MIRLKINKIFLIITVGFLIIGNNSLAAEEIIPLLPSGTCPSDYEKTYTLDTGKNICKLKGSIGSVPGSFEVNIQSGGSGTTLRAATGTTFLPSETIKIQPYKSIIPIPCQNIPGISNVNCAENYNTPGAYILRIYQFALLLVGMAAFGQIVFGGLEYILAAGSFAKIDSAKKRIWDALTGMLLLLGAYFVLFNINPDLVSLRDPLLKTIDTRKLAEQAEQNLVNSADSFTGGQNNGGGTSSGGTLCRRTVNFGVTVNTNIKFEGIQFMKDDDTVTQLARPRELPQIPQSGCFECQPNSSKDSSGTCQCNSGYTQEGNQCLLPKIQ